MRKLGDSMKQMKTDVLIIGSGAAGMRAAIEASQTASVIIISKGCSGYDGATVTAQADVAVDSAFCCTELGLKGDTNDSPEKFAEDMLREGEFIGDEDLIYAHVKNARKEVARLYHKGVSIMGLVHNPGHSSPRGVWISGVELARSLKRELAGISSIRKLDYTVLIDIVLTDGIAVGVIALDFLKGEVFYIAAKAVVLCSGGAMGLYPYVTAPDGLSGDGIAAAFRCGAELTDMEFPMFLPYSILTPDILSGVTFTHDLTMTLNVYALNREGQRYMEKWSDDLEHTTRDINATAAGYEIYAGRGSKNGGVYISLTHIPQNIIDYASEWFPKTLANWRCGGLDLKKYLPDITKNAIETIPACHFWNGGIKVTINGSTNIPGLYAGGEGIAGVHGANRISGNGVTQALVWGAIAGQSAAEWAKKNKMVSAVNDVPDLVGKASAWLNNVDGEDPVQLKQDIQKTAWENIGLIRSAEQVERCISNLQSIKDKVMNQGLRSPQSEVNLDKLLILQNRNLYDVAQLICTAVTERKESRGAHFRLDYQETDDSQWVKNIVLSKDNDGIRVRIVPANNSVGRTPPSVKRPYGVKRR